MATFTQSDQFLVGTMSDSRIHIGDLRPADIALLKNVATEAAELAVAKTFVAMGIDPAKPLEAQKNMQWVTSTRERCEGTIGKALLTIIGLLVLGGCTALWAGIKALLPTGGQLPGGHP